ncbi:MAG: exosortase-associated EpsI family protein [Candidatus Syntropharchaeia archaeon]
MKDFFEEYSKIIGFLLLTFVIVFLFSTPSMIFARSITTIDTELSHATGEELIVRTKMDFGNKEHVQAFPGKIGNWTVSEDYNTTEMVESLNADVILLRAYSHPKLYQPVFFLILQSNNRSSFHPPIVCYPAMGYTIEEEGKERIPIKNASWIEEPPYEFWRKGITKNQTISVKKLIVSKESDGKTKERRVVLYFYVKDRPFLSNTVTMIRVSALAPIEGSYSGILNVSKEFMGETIPYMFEIRKERTIFSILSSESMGKVTIVFLLLFPIAIIFYPQLKRIRRISVK